MRMVIKRKFENDDIAAPDLAIGQKFFVPRSVAAKYKFVHQKMIADQKRGLHRLRRNLESLNDEGGAKKSQQNCDQKRLGILRKGTAPCHDFRRRGHWRGC